MISDSIEDNSTPGPEAEQPKAKRKPTRKGKAANNPGMRRRRAASQRRNAPTRKPR
jgi:hypothetical protein